MSSVRRLAVIGGGHLGTIHAKLLQQLPGAELATIVEPSEGRAIELADQFDCEIEGSFERFLQTTAVDGVIVAAPTSLHHQLGMRLLQRGIHCLIEKPLAPTVSECSDLVAAAQANNCILQVGHVERFNPVWSSFRETLKDLAGIRSPQYIRATREGTLTFRSLDAGVVLDLMIHDIDLVLSVVDSPVISVQATGFHWTGAAEDIAQARVSFANGCVAEFSASRVATDPKRRMEVFGKDWYADIDFAARQGNLVTAPSQKDWQTRQYSVEQRKHLMDSLFEQVLSKRDLDVGEANPILDELQDFVTAIDVKCSPTVNGEQGLAAVDVARQVVQRIEARNPSRHLQVPIYQRQSERKAG